MLKTILKLSTILIATALLWSTAGFAVSQASINHGIQSAAEETSNLTRYINQELTPKLISIALLTAFLLGAVHALSPGHGKAMVASYLIGYSVLPEDFQNYPWMKPATGPEDTGVVISYNT